MNYRFVIVGVLAMLLAFVAPVAAPQMLVSSAAAQASGIVIEGNQRVENDTIVAYLQFDSASGYDADSGDASVKALFQTGLFTDVQIFRRGNQVVIKVEENPQINRVNFEGNSEIKDADLAKEVELRERMMFTRARVVSDVNRIISLYRRSGFYTVTVSPKIIRLPQNRVDLVFEINEGGETKVKNIEFVGNDNFSASDLRGVVGTQEARWWKFFARNDTYDPDRLEYDKELLRRYYLRNGFADVRVIGADAVLSPDGEYFNITYTIEEGPKYKIADVAVNVGDANLDPEDLKKAVRTGVGDVYDASRVDAHGGTADPCGVAPGLRLREGQSRTSSAMKATARSTSPTTSLKVRAPTSSASTSSATPGRKTKSSAANCGSTRAMPSTVFSSIVRAAA